MNTLGGAEVTSHVLIKDRGEDLLRYSLDTNLDVLEDEERGDRQ